MYVFSLACRSQPSRGFPVVLGYGMEALAFLGQEVDVLGSRAWRGEEKPCASGNNNLM